MPKTLTRRQSQILDAIRASVEDRGYPPTLREIGTAVGLTSTSSIAHQLRVIEDKGWITRDPNKPRAMTILPPLADYDTPPPLRSVDEIDRERAHVIEERGREWHA